MQRHNAVYQCQAQAMAFETKCRLGDAVKTFINVRQRLRGNANAGVLHFKDYLAVCLAHCDVDAALWRVFYGVVQYVSDNLLQQGFYAINARFWRDRSDKRNAPRFGPVRKACLFLGNQLGEMHGSEWKRSVRLIQTAQQQQMLYHHSHLLSLL